MEPDQIRCHAGGFASTFEQQGCRHRHQGLDQDAVVIQRELPFADAQIGREIAKRMNHLLRGVEQHGWRRTEPFEQGPVSELHRRFAHAASPRQGFRGLACPVPAHRAEVNRLDVERCIRLLQQLPDLLARIDDLEIVLAFAQRLAGAQKQIPLGHQGVLQSAQGFLLGGVAEIDERVAAHHQVHLGERWIGQQVVGREHDVLPQFRPHHKPVAMPDEKPLEARGRDFGRNRLGVGPRCRHLDVGLVHVRGKNLQAGPALDLVERLHEQHGNRVRLFTGRAARTPHPDGLPVGTGADQGIDHLRGHRGISLGVAEKAGHRDQHLVEQREGFGAVLAQQLQIALDAHDLTHGHAPLDAPQHGAGLVILEIDLAELVEQVKDAGESGFRRPGGGLDRGVFGPDPLAGKHRQVGQDAPARLLDRQDVVHQPGGNGAAGHAVKTGLVRILHQQETTGLVDGHGATGAIGTGTRQDHAHGMGAMMTSQRLEEHVDGQDKAARAFRRQAQPLAFEMHDGTWRNQVDPVRLEGHAVLDHIDRHGGVPGQQTAHHAFVIGRQCWMTT